MTLPSNGRLVLAEFRIDDAGQVAETYYDQGFRLEVQINGSWTLASGNLSPADGLRFLEALPVAFASSSRIIVETVAR